MAEKSTVKPITGFRTQAGDAQYDFNALANKPMIDTTLAVQGAYPDSKAVGDKIKKVEERIAGIQLGDALSGVTINGKKISESPVLTASDVGAATAYHDHSADDITSGVLPIERGGTDSSDGSEGLKNLLACGPMILSSGKQYGTQAQFDELKTRPATIGQIFFLKMQS